MNLDNLIQKWESRYSEWLARAEEGFFENDLYKRQHWSTAARQWKSAIEELKEELKSEAHDTKCN